VPSATNPISVIELILHQEVFAKVQKKLEYIGILSKGSQKSYNKDILFQEK